LKSREALEEEGQLVQFAASIEQVLQEVLQGWQVWLASTNIWASGQALRQVVLARKVKGWQLRHKVLRLAHVRQLASQGRQVMLTSSCRVEAGQAPKQAPSKR
jgi:hypothetical protein